MMPHNQLMVTYSIQVKPLSQVSIKENFILESAVLSFVVK